MHSTINDLFVFLSERLPASQSVWWILESVTGKSRAQLLANPDALISPEQEQKIRAIVSEHVDHQKPLAYCLGFVLFLDLRIAVEPPILIPRPETELWVANLIEQLRQLSISPTKILDLCTGSGCIGLALARAFPQAQVTATDINPAALTLARKNGTHNAITNITFLLSDLFEKIPPHSVDLIVTNPPYISSSEYDELDASVRDWEDVQALCAQDNGLALIKKIIKKAPAYLRPCASMVDNKIPNLLIEIGYQQGEAVQQLMHEAGYTAVMMHKDLACHDRLVSGRSPDAND